MHHNTEVTLGIDAGGTFLKLGNPLLDHLELHPLPYNREFIENFLGKQESLLLTGAGSQVIKSWFPDLKVEIIPELKATGLGGAFLSGYDECIVVNVGSGTPILYVNRKNMEVIHLGGTGMGSASLVGLSHYLTGLTDLDTIGREALKGDPNKVNLLVGDIYPNPEAVGLPGDLTASNFGKYQDWRHIKKKSKPSKTDLLAGLHIMVSETIAVVSTLASRRYAEKNLPIVITGGGTLNLGLVKYLKKTFSFLTQKFIIPEHAVYGTLHGVFVAQELL